MRSMRGLRGMVVLIMAIVVVDAIRVYEGTKLGRPDNSTMPQRRSDPPQKIHRGQLLKYSKELKPTPELYKVKLTQQGYLQFLRYLTDIPPLREYTFCLWLKPSNLTHPQPIFSYSAVQEKSRMLSFWYEPKDVTFRMSVRDDLVLRVPAILQEDKWHHICQSWNGVRGEWIIFFDGAKIGSGQLHKYTGTYIPGGGEVVVGQEPTNFHRGLDDGIEGEVFGFNLVDEAVKDDVFIAKLPEAVPTMYVPPFKTLPPMKKSYQDIKAFIKSLPSEPIPYRTRSGGKVGEFEHAQNFNSSCANPEGGFCPPGAMTGGHPVPKPPHKMKPLKPGPRPQRTKQRRRYKPVKAIIYERDDRQFRLSDARVISKMGVPAQENFHVANQVYNENYSIHSYRLPKEKPVTTGNYEIYETQDEEDIRNEGKRKARQNFNIYTARQANNQYVKASKVRKLKKPIYHFEVTKDKQGIRRSMKIESSSTKKPIIQSKTPIEFIPVYEITEDDEPFFRRKRDVIDDDLTTNFRPLPEIPGEVIDIFADSKSISDADKKINQFFSNRTKVLSTSTAAFTPVTERFHPETDKITARNDLFEIPSRVSLRRNMVVNLKDLERRPGYTAGTELVKRSYEDCTSERGSPVRQDRLVVSWAETPVRIYGGAVVTTAFNVCGHF